MAGAVWSRPGEKAVWKIVEREPDARVARLPVGRSRPLDVDTCDDYLTVCAAFGVEPEPARAASDRPV
jgi:hypothetical protein